MKTMTSLLLVTLVALGSVAWIAGSARAQIDGPAVLTPEAYTTLRQDVEIMQRVLEKAARIQLQNASEGEDPFLSATGDAALGAVYAYRGLLTGVALRSDGFYLPGTGILFALSVPVPMRETPGAKEMTPEDLWQAAEREVRSGRTIPLPKDADAVVWTLEPAAADGTIRALLEAALLHGHRIRGLGPGEGILLHIRLVGREVRGASGQDSLDSLFTRMSSRPASEDVMVRIPVELLARAAAADRDELGAIVDGIPVVRFPIPGEVTLHKKGGTFGFSSPGPLAPEPAK